MNKLIATLVAATFAMGTAFAQTPAKPAAPVAPAAAKAATSASAAAPVAPAASASASASAATEKTVKKVKHAKGSMHHEAGKDAKKDLSTETAKPAPAK